MQAGEYHAKENARRHSRAVEDGKMDDLILAVAAFLEELSGLTINKCSRENVSSTSYSHNIAVYCSKTLEEDAHSLCNV